MPLLISAIQLHKSLHHQLHFDHHLSDMIEKTEGTLREHVETLLGTAAIANARRARHTYLELCETQQWQTLKQHNAQPQRLLWASTGTKNPNYSDVLYVENLIGKETVNTLPMKTLDAFRDHGKVAESLDKPEREHTDVLIEVQNACGSLREFTDKLLQEGIEQFGKSFDSLMQTLREKMQQMKKD